MTRKSRKLSYAEVTDRLAAAANVNEMKAVVEQAGITISDNQLHVMLQARRAEEAIRMAMAKPIKIGKPLSDRQLAKAFPASGTSLWLNNYNDYVAVPGKLFREVFRRWEAGEDLTGDDTIIFENRMAATEVLHRRINVPVRLVDRDGWRRFECGEYELDFEDGQMVAMLAMNYWTELSEKQEIDSLPDSGYEVYVFRDSVSIGCKIVDRADVTLMAVEAGFWKAPS